MEPSPAGSERVTWSTIPAPVRQITLAFILANLGGSMFYDQLAVFLTEEMKATLPQLSIFFFVSALFGSVVRILGGWISDAIGHFRGLGVGSIIGLCGATGLFLSWNWLSALVAYLLVNLGSGFVGPSANAAITRLTPEAIRGRTFGLTSSVFQIVAVLGPSLGGWIIYQFGWKAAMGINVVLFVGATWLRTRLASFESLPLTRPRWRIFLRDMSALYASVLIGGIFGIVLLIDIGLDFQINLTFNLRALFLQEVRGLDAGMRGLLFTVSGLVGMPAMLLGGWLGDRIGELRTMLLALIAGALGFLLFPLTGHLAGIILAFALWGLIGGLFEPAARSLISRSIPKERLGIAFGAVWGSTSLMTVPAAHLGPWLYDHGTPALPFHLAAVCLGLVALVLIVQLPRLEARLRSESAAVQ